MLGERQVAAPLMAQCTAHGALRPAHRRVQPGKGVGVQLAGLRLSGEPQRPAQCQFGHEPLVRGFALLAPAASRPGQHGAVRRQRGRQVAPGGHASTVWQRFLRLVLRCLMAAVSALLWAVGDSGPAPPARVGHHLPDRNRPGRRLSRHAHRLRLPRHLMALCHCRQHTRDLAACQDAGVEQSAGGDQCAGRVSDGGNFVLASPSAASSWDWVRNRLLARSAP